MRRISIESLKQGMKLSLPIRDEHDNILLNRNVELTERYIRRLKDLGFQSVYIADPDLVDVFVDTMISESTRGAAVKHLSESYKKIEKIIRDFKDASVEKIIECLRSKTIKRAFESSGIYASTVRVIENILEDVISCAALNGLNSLKTHNNYTYNHSIDVAVISIMIGKKLQLNVRQLEEVAVGCLLHDIGKVFIPNEILNKSGKLSTKEFELVKEHPSLGYELLRESIPIMPTHIVFQHHERQDGSGYPRGLMGHNTIKRGAGTNRIVLYGEITALADVYDALCSDRTYRRAQLHDTVLDYIKDSAYSHFNAEIVNHFLSIVPRYPVGSNVEVVSGKYLGYKGAVIAITEANLNAPKIRLLFNHSNKRIEPIDIDTSVQFDIRIKIIEA